MRKGSMQSNPRLFPCQNCGSENVQVNYDIQEDKLEGKLYGVICLMCSYQMPKSFNMRKDALIAWNKLGRG